MGFSLFDGLVCLLNCLFCLFKLLGLDSELVAQICLHLQTLSALVLHELELTWQQTLHVEGLDRSVPQKLHLLRDGFLHFH